jgi:hypothetical protein
VSDSQPAGENACPAAVVANEEVFVASNAVVYFLVENVLEKMGPGEEVSRYVTPYSYPTFEFMVEGGLKQEKEKQEKPKAKGRQWN